MRLRLRAGSTRRHRRRWKDTSTVCKFDTFDMCFRRALFGKRAYVDEICCSFRFERACLTLTLVSRSAMETFAIYCNKENGNAIRDTTDSAIDATRIRGRAMGTSNVEILLLSQFTHCYTSKNKCGQFSLIILRMIKARHTCETDKTI